MSRVSELVAWRAGEQREPTPGRAGQSCPKPLAASVSTAEPVVQILASVGVRPCFLAVPCGQYK